MTTEVSKSLYHIREDHLSLLAIVEMNDGELNEEILKGLQLSEVEFQQKAISYGYVVRQFEDTADILDKEIKRLQALKDRMAKRSELFKANLKAGMQEFGVEKITTPTLTISFRKSEAVNIINEALIPKKWMKRTVTVVPDKTNMKSALKAGAKIRGVELETRDNLQIK